METSCLLLSALTLLLVQATSPGSVDGNEMQITGDESRPLGKRGALDAIQGL